MAGKLGAVMTQAFVGAVALISIASLFYVYAFPPASMRVSREGVPHFTPPVHNPATGKPVNVRELVRRYRGD